MASSLSTASAERTLWVVRGQLGTSGTDSSHTLAERVEDRLAGLDPFAPHDHGAVAGEHPGEPGARRRGGRPVD